MKKINVFLASLTLLFFTNLNAEMKYGFSLIGGITDISGTETEGTAADTSARSKSITEQFIGGDLFIEMADDSGVAYGISWVPLDVELGNGSRTDSDGDDAAENDDGTRTAKAELTNLLTAYANVPMGTGGWYYLLGVHYTEVKTTETLNESSYGDEKIFGGQIGVGLKSNNLKYELAYSDFEDIDLTATGGGTNSVSADADALTFKISYGF
tara:strand:- start:585 stop:1220 length:636 start_codon:yes stop_codon:yes gene_type:complete